MVSDEEYPQEADNVAAIGRACKREWVPIEVVDYKENLYHPRLVTGNGPIQFIPSSCVGWITWAGCEG